MNRRTWWGTVVLAAFLALGAVPASAGVMPNGLMPNGLMPNGLMPNGLMPNGLMPNGLMPNGLMPNGLMPNGLMPNGLMPNGLMPNGLMPNGLNSYSIEGGMLANVAGVNISFDQWFARDPAARSGFMNYFVRCAYDATVEVKYRPAGATTSSDDDDEESEDGDIKRGGEKRHRGGDDEHRHHRDASGAAVYKWIGHYGLAMTSLKAKQQMTPDEAKWISSCMLAFVNMKGTHQYISLRGNPPNPEAQAALAPGPNERWIMGRLIFGAFFADLTAPEPLKYVCTQQNVQNVYSHKEDVVLGRNCDVEPCSYTDPRGDTIPLLTEHVGSCWYADSVGLNVNLQRQYSNWLGQEPVGMYRWNYRYWPGQATGAPEPDWLHPIFVNGPELARASPVRRSGYSIGESSFNTDVAGCESTQIAGSSGATPSNQICGPEDAHFTIPIDNSTQVASCGPYTECLGGAPPGSGYNNADVSQKLTLLQDGQAVDLGARFVTDLDTQIWQSHPLFAPLLPDMAEPFTAIVRYSKPRDGSAHLWVTRQDGSWRDVTNIDTGTGPDIWAATGTTASGTPAWEWMQVYPAYLSYDRQTSASLGRHCKTIRDCADGLRLDCTFNTCVKKAIVDPTNVNPPVCEGGSPGQLKMYEARAVNWSDPNVTPSCIEQCFTDDQCGSGGTCMSGQCVQPAIKVRLSGAAMSESCTGPQLFKAANEQGSCSKVFPFMSPKNGTVCPKEFEGAPKCRGALVWTKRKGVTGWFCRGGGEALYQCIADDAPDLDAAAFVPGKPWCAPEGATSFVGVCK